jgi:hypothetical protein
MSPIVRAALLGMLLVPLAAAARQDQKPPTETKPVPSDSLEIATTGCLKGRVFTATEPPEENMRKGPNLTGRSFRLSGPKELMEIVKSHDGDLVQVVGLIRKSDAAPAGPSARIGNTRVTIGAPRSGDPMQSARQPISEGIAVMDASSVRFLSDTCPIIRK